MELAKIEIIKLIASTGMVLTNGEAYGKEIYLGINDNQYNWYEITQEEYDKILLKEEEEAKANVLY